MDCNITVFDAVRVLRDFPKYALSDGYRQALEFAVKFMMDNAPKPSLDEAVMGIRYYCGSKREDWMYCKHVPTNKYIEDMTVRELCELVKSGGLDDDKFETYASDVKRKLPWNYVLEIKNMLVLNGYLTKEEVPKGREST